MVEDIKVAPNPLVTAPLGMGLLTLGEREVIHSHIILDMESWKCAGLYSAIRLDAGLVEKQIKIWKYEHIER